MHVFLTLNNTIYPVRSKVLGQLFLYFENMQQLRWNYFSAAKCGRRRNGFCVPLAA